MRLCALPSSFSTSSTSELSADNPSPISHKSLQDESYDHPAGVADVAFRVSHLDQVIDRVLQAGGHLLSPVNVSPVYFDGADDGAEPLLTRQATVTGWGNLRHTLIETRQLSRHDALVDRSIQDRLTQDQLIQTDGASHSPSRPSALQSYFDAGFEHVCKASDDFQSARPSTLSALTMERSPLIAAIDHVVLNVPKGELDPAVDWYIRAFGLRRQQQFSIQTERSALRSQVLEHPHGNVQLPINEPASPQSQIQEFLDTFGGSGIQHIALRTNDILTTIAHMRQQRVKFIEVPPTYYDQLKQRPEFDSTTANWEAIAQLQILADWCRNTPQALLLQTFTQPLFGKPTFFFEIIQRQPYPTHHGYRLAEGFGEGNFQALFEAIEREQIKRGCL